MGRRNGAGRDVGSVETPCLPACRCRRLGAGDGQGESARAVKDSLARYIRQHESWWSRVLCCPERRGARDRHTAGCHVLSASESLTKPPKRPAITWSGPSWSATSP